MEGMGRISTELVEWRLVPSMAMESTVIVRDHETRAYLDEASWYARRPVDALD
jgi:hypothetical protein